MRIGRFWKHRFYGIVNWKNPPGQFYMKSDTFWKLPLSYMPVDICSRMT